MEAGPVKSRARQVYDACEGWMTIREIEAAIGLPPTNRERQALKAALGWLRRRGLAESEWESGTGTRWRVVKGAEIPRTWEDRPSLGEALRDGMTAKELAEETGRPASSVGASLRKMERRGEAWGEWVPGRRLVIWHRGPAPWSAAETLSEGDGTDVQEVRRWPPLRGTTCPMPMSRHGTANAGRQDARFRPRPTGDP